MALDLQETLSNLIDHELALTHELGAALADERDALRKVDPGALDAATARKQACIEDLSALDSERRHLCTTAGLAPDGSCMERLLIQVDPQGALTQRWQTLLAKLETCREANYSNGAMVRLQKRRVTEALGLLHGEA
ncbi:MAG: flagellar protein FlgN, partial [Gammaproteobacteria bacterium]|nr:flagellar protein FlgN [Gammaproteobacteria bacterium]